MRLQNDSFARDLSRWGPDSSYSTPNLAEAQQYCRNLALTHYENFQVVSWLLPRPLRQHFYNIYAYCRWSDDLADETTSPQDSLRLLAWWRSELEQVFAGNARHPVFVALSTTIHHFDLSPQAFHDLLSAFEQDQHKLRYKNDAEVLDYCTRSANPVGRLVLALGESASEQNIAWSDAICTGLQIANFCQDVSIDAGKNRIYIPRERWLEFRITEEMILERRCTPELQRLLKQWVDYADSFFLAGQPLIRNVPSWLSLDIRLFIAGGRGILQAIRQANYDVWSKRVSLGKCTKLSLVARASWQWWRGQEP